MINISAMAPTGAYCRSIACQLIFLAALRYFSESARSDVESWDIPGVQLEQAMLF